MLHTSGPEATPSSLNSQGQRLRHREHPPSPVLPPVMTCFASLLNWAVLGKAVRDQREAERLRDHPPTWNLTIECLLQTLRKLPVRARTGDYLICCKTARPSDGAKSLSSHPACRLCTSQKEPEATGVWTKSTLERLGRNSAGLPVPCSQHFLPVCGDCQQPSVGWLPRRDASASQVWPLVLPHP